eukprot:4184144-Amphidinium_carterae.1
MLSVTTTCRNRLSPPAFKAGLSTVVSQATGEQPLLAVAFTQQHVSRFCPHSIVNDLLSVCMMKLQSHFVVPVGMPFLRTELNT